MLPIMVSNTTNSPFASKLSIKVQGGKTNRETVTVIPKFTFHPFTLDPIVPKRSNPLVTIAAVIVARFTFIFMAEFVWLTGGMGT